MNIENFEFSEVQEGYFEDIARKVDKLDLPQTASDIRSAFANRRPAALIDALAFALECVSDTAICATSILGNIMPDGTN